MRMRVDIIIMQKKEKGKDSEKEQNRKEMYLHTSLFLCLSTRSGRFRKWTAALLTTVSGRGKCRWSVFFIFKRK